MFTSTPASLKGHKERLKISTYGDANPQYAGSVVKALASAKDNVKDLIESLPYNAAGCDIDKIMQNLSATVENVFPLAENIFEIQIHAPYCAKNFKPGQFFKLQNFETNEIPFEPLALTGASVDKERGIVSLIVLITGTSSKKSTQLKKGEAVVLMGPTGESTFIPMNKNILLIGGGLGNAVLFSIGEEALKNNNHVTYFAAYRTKNSRFKQAEIEAAAHKVIWICEDDYLESSRPQDESFKGNIVDAMITHQDQLKTIDYVIAIGSDGMMRAVAKARFHTLKDVFKPDCHLIGSINSPMQCMMKGICGQCVQVHKNPITQEETVLFSCKDQDQSLASLDFDCLKDRLKQNSLQEKISQFQ